MKSKIRFCLFILIVFILSACESIDTTNSFFKLNKSIQETNIDNETANDILKNTLKEKSPILKVQVEKLDTLIKNFDVYMDALSDSLIMRAGGYDPHYDDRRPVLYKDKNVTTAFFITEKNGTALKKKIETTRNEILSFIEPKELKIIAPQIPLTVDEIPEDAKNKTWEELKFKLMPVAAVLPTLSKIKADAHTSERIVLEYFKLKN
jgi:GldM N-terminal domain